MLFGKNNGIIILMKKKCKNCVFLVLLSLVFLFGFLTFVKTEELTS